MTKELNERLEEAVTYFDVERVRQALVDGANPNFVIELPAFADRDLDQPDTPLKLVMFRISDASIGDAELIAFAEIARILIDHGADPLPAMAIAKARYGPYDPSLTGRFADVWHVVARAAEARSE